MEGGEIFTIIGSMLASFLLGAVGMLFFGGRTALNYLMVKVSRGRKVLMMCKTTFGWRSFVGKKTKNVIVWTYDKTKVYTNIDDGDVVRYLRVDLCFVDADKPASAIKLKKGNFYPDDFDPQTFNNILIRALSRPNVDGNDDLKKMLVAVLIFLGLIGLGVAMIYLKLDELGATTGVI